MRPKIIQDGLEFDLNTPRAVRDLLCELSKWRRSQQPRVHISYGCTEVDPRRPHRTPGRDDLREHYCYGYIGRCAGSLGGTSLPLIVYDARCHGGPAISTGRIVRIREARGGKVLYQHPTYHHGDLVAVVHPTKRFYGQGEHRRPYCVTVYEDSAVHLRLEFAEQAMHWAKRLGVALTVTEEEPDWAQCARRRLPPVCVEMEQELPIVTPALLARWQRVERLLRRLRQRIFKYWDESEERGIKADALLQRCKRILSPMWLLQNVRRRWPPETAVERRRLPKVVSDD